LFFAYSIVQPKSFDLDKSFQFGIGTLSWLDNDLYHVGYNPKVHESFQQDNHFGVVFYLTLLLIAVLGAIAWTFAGKKRVRPSQLELGFTLYIRFVLAITIICYGIDKLIPVQMRYPGLATLMGSYCNLSLFRVLWHLMGVSPGFMMLVGASEVLAWLLLFFPRTYLFGSLFLFVILSNVVAMNWFYNIPVKMYSAPLLLYTLF